jgi:hypothetical protein
MGQKERQAVVHRVAPGAAPSHPAGDRIAVDLARLDAGPSWRCDRFALKGEELKKTAAHMVSPLVPP